MNQRLSLIFFFLLFPGTFFYSSAVAAQLIPPVIGGGFGFFSALAVAALLPALLLSTKNLKGTSLILSALVLGLIIYCSAWLLTHHFLKAPYPGRLKIPTQWATLILTWISLFSIGYFWPSALSKKYIALLLISMVGMSATVLLNVDFSRLIFEYGLSDQEGTLSYQGLARSVAATGLVLVSVVRNMRVSIGVTILLIITLFFIGARSEFAGVVAVLPFIAYLHFQRRPLTTVAVGIATGLLILGSVIYLWDDLSNSRHFQLLNIEESSSGRARVALHEEALQAISRKPILGDFGGHASTQEVGGYAHSILSAWRQLGVLGFLLYLTLLLAPFVLSTKQIHGKGAPNTDLPRITGTLSLFLLILILGAKPIFWAFPALAWGLIVACYRRHLSPEATEEKNDKHVSGHHLTVPYILNSTTHINDAAIPPTV